MSRDDAIRAKQLEQDAEAYPEDRAECLIEAAGAWNRAGEPDRAIELYKVVVDLGGDDGCFARTDLADLYRGRGEFDRMNAELDALARDPDLDVTHCELVADMLAEHGDLKAAVRWYDRAVARMSPEAIEALGDQRNASNFLAQNLVRHRSSTRHKLGLAPDVLDELVAETSPGHRSPARQSGGSRTQVLMFQRAELSVASLRWPSVFDEAAEDYYAHAERVYRDFRNAGLSSIRLVPAKAADLAAFAAEVGESVEDASLRSRFAASADPATTIAWPPERNAACWCGSDRKYKKCCGRPQS